MKSGYSYKVVLREYCNWKGQHSLYLRVIINRKKRDLALGLHVNPIFFNIDSAQMEKCQANSKYWNFSDQEISDFNLMIKNEVAKATNIFVEYRLSRRDPEMNDFIRQFTDYDKRDSFLSFFQRDLNNRKDLAQHTRELHQNTINIVSEFQKEVKFMDVTIDFLNTFDRWLKVEKKHNHNTRAREHRDLHQYLLRAIKTGIRIADPYIGFKWPTTTRSIVFLTQDELKQWTDYYFSAKIKPTHAKSLRHFLFMCYTSLRISDAKELIKRASDSKLIFIPKKTFNTKGAIIELPLNDMAKKFMNAVGGEKEEVSDSTVNADLKEIAIILGTDKNISSKVGRHTFATVFLERGGAVEVLQQILGHSDIEDTMVYVHITNERKTRQIEEAFNGFHFENKPLFNVKENIRKKGSGRKKV